jgi:oligogalacturonide transporter
MKERKLKWYNIVGYGAADIFGNGALTVASTWMLFFYTSVGGLSPVAAGSILGIARICDSFISPLMGYLTDHFGNTWLGKKFGRRRFFLIAAIPLMFIYVIIWMAHMNYWFYLVTYLLMEAFTAMVMIPYETLASEMTMDYDIRTKMTSSRMLWAAIATFLASWLPGRFFAIFGKSSSTAFLANGITLSAIFIITLMITYFTTWERPNDETTAQETVQENRNPFSGLWHAIKDMGSVFRIKSYALHLIIYLFTFTARDIMGATYVYFVVYAIQSNSIQASNLMTFGSLIGIPCNLIWPKVMAKLGPSRMLRMMYIVMFGTAAAYGLLYLSPLVGTAQILIFMYVLQFTWGVSNSGTGYVPWTVYTFMPDVDEIVTKERREGVFAGIMTFARKTTSALAPFLTGVVLEASGFVNNAKIQSGHALDGLVLWIVIGVGSLLLVATIVTYFFKLDKRHHQILVNEINRLKNGGEMADVRPETKKVCEDLTGMKYEKLWGHNNLL